MFKNYIKIALRGIKLQKTHSFINIGGLAIAMTASILILLWVQNEVRFDNYHPDADRIYLIAEYDEKRDDKTSALSPFVAHTAIQLELPEVERIAMGRSSEYSQQVFEVNGQLFHENNALYIDYNWLKMFHYDFVEGNLGGFDFNHNQLIITRSKARKFFGNQSAMGQTILIDSIPFTVGAVVEDQPANSSFQQEVLIPNHILSKDDRHLNQWGAYSQMLFVKLHTATPAAKTAGKITKIFHRNQTYKKEPTTYHKLLPLLDLHFNQDFRDSAAINTGNPQNIRIFSVLAMLLLLTASVNFVNLSIAKMGQRSKEIGIRKIVGANKKQLFTQVMTETALAVVLSLMLTMLLVVICLPYFNAFTERNFTFNLLDPYIALLLLATFLSVLLLTGIYPALLLADLRPIGLFRGKTLLHVGQQMLRNILVTGQFVLATVMLIGVITIYRQFGFIQQQSAGYQMEQIFRFRVDALPENKALNRATSDELLFRFLQTFKNELVASSAIKEVTKVNGVSMLNESWLLDHRLSWDGYPDMEESLNLVTLNIDEDYQRIANFDFLAGRWFDPSNVSDRNNIILNETAVKTLGLKEPVVGTTFNNTILGEKGMVIGVVKDFHHKSLHEKIDPVMIQLDRDIGLVFIVQAHNGRAQDAIQAAQNVWNKRYTGKPFEYTFLDEEFDQLYKEDRKALSFSTVFAGLSVLISSLGLLGMAMFAAQQRTKEIGIRKVLGATVSGIVALLSKDFVKLVLVAIVIASPIAWWAMNKWLEDFAYRIDMEWWVFALAGLAAVVIALATVSWQAIRGAMVNPVDSLRDE